MSIQNSKMYLVDTNVISEARKQSKANKGVQAFFKQVIESKIPVFISIVTVGELRRGIELIRYRGDAIRARKFESEGTDHAERLHYQK